MIVNIILIYKFYPIYLLDINEDLIKKSLEIYYYIYYKILNLLEFNFDITSINT